MDKIICGICNKEIKSLDELVTCSTGLFKVGAFHDCCYRKGNKKNNIIIYKPDGGRRLHLAAMLFTVFTAAIMIFFRKFTFVTAFCIVGITILDIYIYMSFSKIELPVQKKENSEDI